MTNQASEDELRESIDALLERWRNILTHKGDGNGDEYYQSEVVDDIQELIRTEKLKLLDEVRERQIPVIALKAKKPHDEVQIQAVPIESLSELEAEL